MGMVRVKISGSFGNKGECYFSAQEGGHAYALTRAIAYLVTQMAPAIVKDHVLHNKGESPQTPFGTSGVKKMDETIYCKHNRVVGEGCERCDKEAADG